MRELGWGGVGIREFGIRREGVGEDLGSRESGSGGLYDVSNIFDPTPPIPTSLTSISPLRCLVIHLKSFVVSSYVRDCDSKFFVVLCGLI